MELGLRVRDNTRAGFVKPRGSLSGTLRGIHTFRGVGNVDLGLRVGMLRGNPRMARGFGAPRGRRVEKSPVHRDSNPRMARGFGAPRGRRVEKSPKCPSNTTNSEWIRGNQCQYLT